MKLALVALLVTALGASAHAEDVPNDPAVVTARAWLGDALATGKAAATKKAPIDYVIHGHVKACRGLKAGRATTAKAARKLVRCLRELRQAVYAPDEPPANIDWTITAEDAAAIAGLFDGKAQKKKVKASAKGARWVHASFVGSTDEMTVYVVVGADGAVRAIWVWSVDRA